MISVYPSPIRRIHPRPFSLIRPYTPRSDSIAAIPTCHAGRRRDHSRCWCHWRSDHSEIIQTLANIYRCVKLISYVPAVRACVCGECAPESAFVRVLYFIFPVCYICVSMPYVIVCVAFSLLAAVASQSLQEAVLFRIHHWIFCLSQPMCFAAQLTAQLAGVVASYREKVCP